MKLELMGPTSAEGACNQSKKIEVEPLFFVGIRSQVVQRIVVRGAGGAEEHYIMRVSENGKLSLSDKTVQKTVVPKFDKIVPANLETKTATSS